MSRLLTLMMIAILVIAHGSSVAASVCRHQSAAEHVAALSSHDARIAAVALGEEAAGKVASKKGQTANPASWPPGTLPAPDLSVPIRPTVPVERSLADSSVPPGATITPLLEPPAA
ncbi:MAG: hypothetical protein ACJ8ER_14510 [Allosphingosinicella sp.]